MCMTLMKCRIGCPMGTQLDPRESCKCVDNDVVDALYECETEPECALTTKDCPSENFSIDEENCECVCDKFCIATMNLNPDTCTCEPIKEPEPTVTNDLKCDEHGRKICPKNPPRCPWGERYDDGMCMCVTAAVAKCLAPCPYGQTFDPRGLCECTDIEEVEALYTCEPEPRCDLTAD